jgi:hypothetical protein
MCTLLCRLATDFDIVVTTYATLASDANRMGLVSLCACTSLRRWRGRTVHAPSSLLALELTLGPLSPSQLNKCSCPSLLPDTHVCSKRP